MNATYYVTDEGVEFKQWRTVRNLMGSVLPAPIQSRIRLMSLGRASKPTRSLSADEAGMVAARRTDQQAIPDSHAAITAFNGGKWFASTVASAAALWAQSPNGSSGIDWKSGSQGLELILNSGREYVGSPNADYNSELERAAYINGAQYVLQGLPRDLEPAEMAMLHRALPPAVAASTSLPAAGNGQQTARTPGSRNWVHAIALCWLWCISALIAWLGPQLVHYAHKAVQLEQEHKYFTRSLAAAIRLICEIVRWTGDSKPGQVMSFAIEYTSQGVYSAIQEFAEGNIDHGRLWGQEPGH
ncbi:hypothetical protein MMYC01_207583 [Madurella mycetomatis]|uniref:Uncharacterized protein n=1 Tax=Madurella mycetomatis TaxID=100816 RepID=A0A175VWS3_9PEZI|nr:hypothetical protein MMYC01_207583 [Madurella mycetomatis]